MTVFVQMEITSGVILLVAFAVMLPFHVLTLHYRHFAPLRDVQPVLCMLCHGGYLAFTTHLFFDWYHAKELCYELAMIQMAGCVLLYGCFACKYYTLHKRYRIVATPLPTAIVMVLSSFPFLLLATYRVAVRTEDHCPEVDAVAGGCGLLIWGVVVGFIMLKEHPSSHFVTARNIELAALLCSIVTSFVHQWFHQDGVTLALLFASAIAANASFLGFVFPPIRLALQHGNEFTDEHQRMLNDSLYGTARSPMNSSPESGGAMGCCNCCVEKIACCFRVFLTDNSDAAARDANSSIVGSPTAAAYNGSSIGAAGPGEGAAASPTSRDRLQSGTISPARQRQETETQQELQEIIKMIQEEDFYRLQRVVSRRGVALINLADEAGRTPLHHAARVGEINAVRFLLAMGADANKFDLKGRAPLHDAVRSKTTNDRSTVITDLLKHGAVVNLPTKSGATALHIAVQSGHLGAVNTLLRHDANPLFQHDKEDATLSWQDAHVTHVLGSETCRKSPLTVAVETGNDKMVSSMLHSMRLSSKSKFNGDVRCVHGLTLLHVALCLGNHAVVKVLLSEGSCSPWTMNEETGMNCFHMSAVGDNAHCVAALLGHMGVPDLLPEETQYTESATLAQISGSSGANDAPVASGKAPQAPLRTLGAGFDMFHASTGSVPTTPMERFSRGPSFGAAGGGKRVAYGCASPTITVDAHTMGFGEAMAALRDHIPSATADLGRLEELEAAVDRVVTQLRAKSNVHEIERLHCAMLVVAKRLRCGSSRSVAMMMSSQSFPGGTGSTTALPMSKPIGTSDSMDAIRTLLRKADQTGCTPLHYAIQGGNALMVHIFAAYGAVASDEEVPRGSSLSGSNGSLGSGERENAFHSLSRGLSGGCVGGVSPPSDERFGNDTKVFLGGVADLPLVSQVGKCTQAHKDDNLDDVTVRAYSRDIRRYIENDAMQALIMAALRDGMETRARFLREGEET